MSNRPPVRYRIEFPSLAAHRVRVTMEIDDAPEGGVFLAMPVWTPGSYLVREFARHVVSISAARATGDPVPVTKVEKNAWRVDTKPGKRVDVTYELYANELSVRTNHVDADHAFLQPAATFLFVRGREAERASVSIGIPEGWRVFAPLPLVGEDTWLAEDLDALMDAPFEIGPHPVLSFAVGEVPHRIAVFGEGNLDAARLTGDVHAICLVAKEVFPGPHPSSAYTFVFHVAPGARGGLEHADCSVCGFEPFAFEPERSYLRRLSLVAHEYFHLWNGKRIRPRELGPFDYEREVTTRHLWVVEGVTSYYQDLILARAGVASAATVLDEFARKWRALAEFPGRFVDSAAAASFDAWVKLYRPHEATRNLTVSYYLKGALIGLCLDLAIRAETDGERGLDDAMSSLWALAAGRPEEGYSHEELLDALSDAAGRSLEPEVSAFAEGTDELPLGELLGTHGLELVPEEGGGAWLGVNAKEEAGRLLIAEVLSGSPAEAAGISAGDELVALAGWRTGKLRDVLATLDPGEEVPALVARRGRVRELALRPGEAPPRGYRIRPREDADEPAARRFTAWLGVPFAAAVEDPAPVSSEERSPIL